MRGVAAVLAIAATWVAVTGWTPAFRIARPTVSTAAVLGSAMVAGVTATVAFATTGIGALAAACAVLAGSVPIARDIRTTAARRWEAHRAWPDILAHVRTALAGGATVVDALVDALDAGSDEHQGLADRIRRETMFGGGLEAAITDLGPDQLDSGAQRILEALATASRVGGPRVGEIVTALGRSVSDDIRLRESHRAALSEQRMTVAVALVAPWVMLALAVATNPQAADAFSNAQGSIVIGIGTVTTMLGWLLAARAARLSAPPEVFE